MADGLEVREVVVDVERQSAGSRDRRSPSVTGHAGQPFGAGGYGSSSNRRATLSNRQVMAVRRVVRAAVVGR